MIYIDLDKTQLTYDKTQPTYNKPNPHTYVSKALGSSSAQLH